LAASQTRTHTDAVLTLEAGLAQWVADLDAMAATPHTTALDWDGRVLRITRRHSSDPGAGLLIAAWTRGQRDGVDQWLRWQSAPVRTRGDWQAAWRNATQWAQSPSDISRLQEVVIVRLVQWQIFYYRGGTWSNALSSAANAQTDGIRLVLSLPPSHPLGGGLTRDWARPAVASGLP
jgi:general secretion pathway protein J